MKKRMPKLMALVLTLVLCLGSVQSVFADGTFTGVNERDMEKITYTFMNDVEAGKYKTVDTPTLKSWIDSGKDMVIVDTMPESSFDSGHVPTALGAEVGQSNPKNDFYKFQDKEQQAHFKAVVESQIPNKTVLVKVSKSQYNKLAKAKRTTKKVKGKTVYYKKTVGKDKSYPIVVYCGYIKCARSHTGAAYLRSLGYTNVYRYGGGIFAWKEDGNTAESRVYVNAEYVNSKLKDWNVVLLDVRRVESYAEERIEGSVSASTVSIAEPDKAKAEDGDAAANIKAAVKKYGKDKEYILICYSGNRYANAAQTLLLMEGVDCQNIKTLGGDDSKKSTDGGMKAWKAAGYPVVTE